MHTILFVCWVATASLLPLVSARGMGSFGMKSMMRNNMKNQYGPPKEKKRTESVKPTFIRTAESSSTGGIDHVVLLKLDIQEATKSEIRGLGKRAQRLTTIDGVESVTAGQVVVDPDRVDRTGGYNYYMRIRLKSTESLKAFDADPLHQELYQKIDHILKAPPLSVECAASAMSSTTVGTARNIEQTPFPQKPHPTMKIPAN